MSWVLLGEAITKTTYTKCRVFSCGIVFVEHAA